jgi:dihydrofolate synthase/folylpolyglutamate synthase
MLSVIGEVREVIDTLRRNGTLDVQPTFFEVTTAVAFELFRQARVNIAVVEVGLGGRLDATNVLSPVTCAITSIAFDHQLYLGSTLRAIALEKAGIIKPGIPVVIGEMAAEARAAIEEVGRQRSAPIVVATEADLAGRPIALRGRHQRINAAIARRVLQVAGGRGYPVGAEALDAAVTQAAWPGRLDLRTLADGRQLLLDAAHNPAGAAALASYLRDAGLRPPLIFAAMRDKDAEGMFRPLLPAVDTVIVTRAHNLRSADPTALAAVARAVDPSKTIGIEDSLPSALDRAWREAPLVLVAGSIFLLGDVMQHLGLH